MIHTELCWVVREDEQAASRASGYRAPTWSWASIDGAVEPVVPYSSSNTQAKHEIRSEIELLDVDVSVANDGQITSAPMFLCGRLRSGRLTRIGGARAPTVFKITNDAPDNNSTAAKGSGKIYLDPMPPLEGGRPAPINKNEDGIKPPTEKESTTLELQQSQSLTYQLLHVTTRQWRHPDNDDDDNNKNATAPPTRTLYEVLALEPIKGSEAGFIRVGAGEMTFDSWFEKQPLQRICIF